MKIELSKEKEIGVKDSGAVFFMCLQSRIDCIPYSSTPHQVYYA